MRLYQCPACDCLPVRFKKPPQSPPKCIRCGRYLIKKSRLSGGYLWAVGLSSAVVIALFLPHLFDFIKSKSRNSSFVGLTGSLAPDIAVDRMSPPIDPNHLLSKLEDADLQWQPQEELLPDGGVRYLYKRRSGEPDLSVAELRSLMDNPPTFHRERQAILALLESLRQAGVKVLLTPTLKKGAAAEWDHRQAVLRIQPQMTAKGSQDFLRVLNHEAIHVAQSCRGGTLRARPQVLGLPIAAPSLELKNNLNDPVYANASDWEKELEREAYGLQNEVSTAKKLVKRECKPQKTLFLS